jgi:GH15 family glucan-1,4-alpha-glucosidase
MGVRDDELFEGGFARAVENLRSALTPEGFVASTTDHNNYQRVWGRDGVIVSLAALLLEDEELRAGVLATLRTLMHNQGPHGEIPSNVDTSSGNVSYGGTAGRVDADLWFLIGCHRYWQETKDSHFLDEFMPSLKKVEFLLGAWEFNRKGLLYVPETGDWADEYLQHGYVLYDQLLYWRALKGLSEMYEANEGIDVSFIREKVNRLAELIKVNYWLNGGCDPEVGGVYHPVIYQKGCDMSSERKGEYWLPYFSPTGYGYRFDAMANTLVSLFGLAREEQQAQVDGFISKLVDDNEIRLLPAFAPVIQEIDEDWKELQATFSYTFRNKPYEYHNGGLWPLVTGFYVVDLAGRGLERKAKDYLKAIHQANYLGQDEEWGFHEFINGKSFEPQGTRHQTWSAGAVVMGQLALEGKKLFY